VFYFPFESEKAMHLYHHIHLVLQWLIRLLVHLCCSTHTKITTIEDARWSYNRFSI